MVGGLVGGAAVIAAGYGYYHFSGTKSLVDTAHATKVQFQKLSSSFKESTPEPNEALEWLRSTSLSYAAFIPGAKSLVNSLFNDIDAVERKHKGEVNGIVKEAYGELQELSKKGDASLETAQKAWMILQKHLEKLGELAADASDQIIQNHPELKKVIGDNVDQLKQMGQSYGPEAKKQVDETMKQIKDVTKNGFNADTISKIQEIVQQSVDKLKKFGDDAWNKGLEQIQPQLDKSPKLKEFIEKNKEKLKQGNLSELWSTVKKSADSGDTKPVEELLKSGASQAKEKSSAGFEQIFKMVPSGAEISTKFSQLQDIAKNHGDEATDLVNKTFDDIKQVLQKRLSEAEKIKAKAEAETKKV